MNKCKYCYYRTSPYRCDKECISVEFFKKKLSMELMDKQFDCEYFEREPGCDDDQ